MLPPSHSVIFPTELLELIIFATWHLPLSSQDRIIFMTSSALVSRAWADLFSRVSSMDVFIPSPNYLSKYLAMARDAKDTQNKSRISSCRSMSLTINYKPLYMQPRTYETPRMAKALSNLLCFLSGQGERHFPNLQRLSVDHANATFDADIFDVFLFNPFPTMITDLNLLYSYHLKTPPWLIEASKARYGHWQKSLTWSFSSVRRLYIVGGPKELVTDVAMVCPNLEDLSIDRLFDTYELSRPNMNIPAKR